MRLLLDLNGALFDRINESAGHIQLVDDFMKLAARLGVYAVLALVAASWFVPSSSDDRRRVAVYTAILAAVVALGITLLIQQFYVHQRPFVLRDDVNLLMHHSADASFPSEHTSVAFGLAAGLGLYRYAFGIASIVAAAAMAFARIYVGIHYPADVAAAAAIGILAALAVFAAHTVLEEIDRRVVIRLLPPALR